MPDTPRWSRLRRRPAAWAIAAALAGLALLAACSGPGTSQPLTITVQGRVVDELLSPVANASILVGSTVTTTAADGTFTMKSVQPPYDVVVAPSGTTTAWDFEGLTRTDPTLSLYAIATVHSATIAGSIGGGTLQTNEQAFILPGGATRTVRNVQIGPGGGPAFGGYITWSTTDPLDTTLYALRALFDTNGNPISYTGFGSLTITLHDGDALTALAIPTQSVQTGAVSGGIRAPSGYTVTGGRMLLRFGTSSVGEALAVPLANVNLATGTFSSTMVPEATGIRYGLAGTASGPSGQGVAAWGEIAGPGSAASLTLPVGPSTTSPLDGSSNVAAGATLSWTAVPNSVYVVDLSPHNNGSGSSLLIVTTKTSVTLPDLSVVNRSLAANAQYDYGVWATGPFASVDAAASPDGMWGFEYDLGNVINGVPASASAASGAIVPGWASGSAYVSFTTAP